MLDLLIAEIYNMLYMKFDKRSLYFNNNLVTNNINLIIEFLGLCHRIYRNGIKKDEQIFEYIKGSHYFNIECFKNEQLKLYHKTHLKKNQFDYKKHKQYIISENEYASLDKDQHLFIKRNDKWIIKMCEFENHKIKEKHTNINFIEDRSVFYNRIKNFL